MAGFSPVSLFTVAEARAELVELLPVLEQIVALRADATELSSALNGGPGTRLGGRPELKFAQARLDELLAEVQATGAELKGIAPLLVDFPSELDVVRRADQQQLRPPAGGVGAGRHARAAARDR